MSQGDGKAAEALFPLVYAELHRLARAYMRRERPDHALQATALINEAYLRLAQQDVDWNSRAHFIGIAPQVMRRVLVELRPRAESGLIRAACALHRGHSPDLSSFGRCGSPCHTSKFGPQNRLKCRPSINDPSRCGKQDLTLRFRSLPSWETQPS
jgi:hypothetical protein